MNGVLSRESLRDALTVDEVLAKAEAVHKKNLDEEGELKQLEVVSANVLQFNGRNLYLTDNARAQLGSMFGVKWDKWFAQPNIGPEQIQAELRLRLKEAHPGNPLHGTKKFRIRLGDAEEDSALRAIVSPAYVPIDDWPLLSQAIDRQSLRQMFLDTDVRMISAPWNLLGSDASTYATFLLNEPIEIQDEGDEEKDIYYPAIHIGNSEVGRRAVTIEDALIRVICVNGLIRVLEKRNLLRQAHRRVDFEDVYTQATEAVRIIKRRLPGLEDRIRATHKRELSVEAFDMEAEAFIKRSQLPKAFKEKIDSAFAHEPKRTVFGLVQAITLAAQGLSPEYAVVAERHAAALLN